jgi:general secretion pathway protein M
MAAPDRTPNTSPLTRIGQRVGSVLQGLSPREQRAVSLAAWVLGLGLLWWVGLAPAVKTLREAPARHAVLDAQLARMQQLAASAEVLRTQNATPPPSPEAAQRALQAATQALGAGAQLAVQGDRATVTLRDAPPLALAQWLNQVRVNARLLPVEAQMQRAASGGGWSGQIVLAGPGLGSGN